MMSNNMIWLFIFIVLATNLLTAIVIIDTYRRRVYELRRRHALELEAVQQEQANVRMKARVLDAVPVSRLIGEDSTP